MKIEGKVNKVEGALDSMSTITPQRPREGFEEMLAHQCKEVGLNVQYESIPVITAPSEKIDSSLSRTENPALSTITSVECDYERNPTSLYKLLEQSEWKLSRIRARTFSDEVQTWVVRRDSSSSSINIKWRLLPLHASILFRAPFDVVEALFVAYPEAVKAADDKGMLPLHMALRQDEIQGDVLSLLLHEYPEAVNMKDNKGRVPIALAKNGRAQLSVPMDHPKTGESTTLMKIYTEASMQAMRNKMNDKNRDDSSSAPSTSLKTGNTPVSDGITETREPNSTDIVKGTVVEAPNKFNELMHLAELRTQAEAHERQMARLIEENENSKRELLDDFEERTRNQEKIWKSRVSILKEEHKLEIEQLKSDHESTLQKLNSEHDLSMDELRMSLDKDIVDTRDLNTILKEEVADLKKKYEATSDQSDMYKTLLEGMKIQRSQLSGDIQAMAQDQDDIIQVVLKQRQEIETAYAIRDKIINSLLEQEDDDRLRQIQEGDDLMDLVESSRDRMGAILKRFPVVSSNGSVIGGSVAGTKSNNYIGGGRSVAASYGFGLSSIREDPRFVHDGNRDISGQDEDEMSALTERSH